MDHKHSFPNLLEAFGIIFALFALQIMLGALIFDAGFEFQAGDPAYSLLLLILSIGTVISLIMHYKQLSYSDLFNQSGSSFSSMLFVLGIPLFLVAFGSVIWISDLTSVIIKLTPMTEAEAQMFQRIFNGGATSFLLICIVAPLIEEILFRGIILRGLLNHYPAPIAIALCAMVFATYHLNLYQFPVALAMGSFAGWLYYKTRSLWPAILAHSFYNSTAYVYFLLAGPDNMASDPTKVEFHGLAALALGIICTLAGISLLNKILSTRPV